MNSRRFLLFLWYMLSIVCAKELQFPIHRMVQFKTQGTPFGTQQNSIDMKLSSISSILALDKDSRLKPSQLTVFAKIEELNPGLLDNFLEVLNIGGLLIIIPSSVSHLSEKEVTDIRAFEKYMMQKSFEIPVFFILEDADVSHVYKLLTKNASSFFSVTDSYAVNVKFPRNTKPTTLPSIRTLESVLEGKVEGKDQSSVPVIAIAATYDSFTLAPQLPRGGSVSASNTITILELMRLFSHLYKQQQTNAQYSMRFLLSGAGHLDYEGYRQWLMQTAPSDLNNVLFMLCIDNIGSADRLKLQVSRQATTEELKRFYSAFESVSKELNIPFELSYSSVSIESAHRLYPHERFSLNRIPAGTLMSQNKNVSPYMFGSMVDDRINESTTQRNIQLIAESLARFMFNVNDGLIFHDTRSVNSVYINHWMDLMNNTPLHSLHVTKDHPALEAMRDDMARFAPQSTKVTDSEPELRDKVEVFASNSNVFTVYKFPSPMVDLIVFFFVVAFLVLFYVVVGIVQNGYYMFVADISRSFSRVSGAKNKVE